MEEKKMEDKKEKEKEPEKKKGRLFGDPLVELE